MTVLREPRTGGDEALRDAVIEVLRHHGPSLASTIRRSLPSTLTDGLDAEAFRRRLLTLEPHVAHVPPGWRFRVRSQPELDRLAAEREQHARAVAANQTIAATFASHLRTPDRACADAFTWLLPGCRVGDRADPRLAEVARLPVLLLAWSVHRMLRRPQRLRPADPWAGWLEGIWARDVWFLPAEDLVERLREGLLAHLPPCSYASELALAPAGSWPWRVSLSALFDPSFGQALAAGSSVEAWLGPTPSEPDPGFLLIGTASYGGHGAGGGAPSRYGRRYPGGHLPSGHPGPRR